MGMSVEAIQALRNKGDRKGISRQAIARWIQINHKKEGGGQFNKCLSTALDKGMKDGVLKAGETTARFKVDNGLPKAKKPAVKKTNSKKKNSAKKKTGSKKKTATKKTNSKKKSGSKKKTSSKKKGGK